MILRAFVVPKQMLEKIVAQFPALLDRHFVISICDPGEARPLPAAALARDRAAFERKQRPA